jgi:type II secretory pathway pseudopilin PulG
MNLKRWFAWTCLVLVLVAEVALFRAYRQKDELQAQLQSAQANLWQAQDQLAALEKTDVGLQAAEISRLGKINQILTNKVNELETAILPVWQASQSNAQHLATARLAIQMQQQHLQQLESENNQIVDASTAVIDQKTCLNNLRAIDDAKQEWARASNQADTAVPTQKELLPYLKDNVFPVCPGGGKYSINTVNEAPTCSIPAHNYAAAPVPAAAH